MFTRRGFATMIAAGLAVAAWEAMGPPFRVSGWEWAAVVAGGLIEIAAFCWDWRTIAAGGVPGSFPWPLFFVGEVVGFGGFLHSR